MTASRLISVLFLICLISTPVSFAQDASETRSTEERLELLKQQIEEDQRKLSETAEAERATVETLEDLNRQITLRTELIRNYRRRMQQITHESDTLRSTLSQMEGELGRLRRQYEKRAIHAYKYGRMHDLALILSAESINQMLIRIRYLHRFTEQRRTRLDDIEQAGAELKRRREELRGMLSRNEQLLREEEQEQRNLETLKGSRQRVISTLRTERTQLERTLENERAAAQELENRLRRLTVEASTRRRVLEAANPDAAAEFVQLSGSFMQNRGRLPWPTSGVVHEPFGDVINPVYGTKTPNPGVIISTPASAEVRSVFDGQVIDVSVLPEYGTYVVIEHGDYKTVYSNFSMTYVGEGDRVKAGQVIGRAGTDSEPKGKAVFFALFKEGKPVDPVPWLKPQ